MKMFGKAALPLLAGFAFNAAMAHLAAGAVITVSDTAPLSSVLSNPYSAATVGTQTNYIDYTDNGGGDAVHGQGGTGQTFVIPSGGLTINSVTVKLAGGLGNSVATSNYYVGIQAIDGNSVTNIYRTYDGGSTYQRAKLNVVSQENATGGALLASDLAAGDTTEYVTFTFGTPVVLSGATQTAYNFSIGTDSAYVGLAVNNFAYNAGNDDAVNVINYNDGTTSLGLSQSNGSVSKVFYINAAFTPVPEPASCGLVILSTARLLSRRR